MADALHFCQKALGYFTGTDANVIQSAIETTLKDIGEWTLFMTWLKDCQAWSEFWKIQTLICKDMSEKFWLWPKVAGLSPKDRPQSLTIINKSEIYKMMIILLQQHEA